MTLFVDSASSPREMKAKLDALDKSQAVIEFNMDGTIITANPNFLGAVGYALNEIKGKHHSMFVDAAYKDSAEYREFWASLNRGEFQAAQYKRFAKGGREIWIEASYNPVTGPNGKPVKVVKYATDITEQKRTSSDYLGQINAIHKSQAVIEFDMDGTILTANPNFLGAVGYTLQDIQGKHHSMFVDPAYRDSGDYKDFWAKLNRGEYQAGQYKRFGKGNREIWIEASYNPILDWNGKPMKVVKYATDITKQVQMLDNVKRLIDGNLGDVIRVVGDANQQSTRVARASMETSQNVQAVASGAEELNASVNEIANSMSKSKNAVDTMFDQAKTADDATKRLTASTQAMVGIIDLIQNIAGQINLLSLNATIESARAGEAGKGFAVVASEVKNLARQAGEATDQIAKEIEGMRVVSGDVVASLDAIKTSIETVREFVTNTASAVEEQSAVTQDISSNMQSAAQAVTGINDNIRVIESATQSAETAMRDTIEAAQVLSR